MPDIPALRELGFSPRWQALFEPFAKRGLTPARVIRGDRGSMLVVTPAGVVRAKLSARGFKSARGTAAMPVVGDWVAVRVGGDLDVSLIEAVLERSSAITRGDPGGVEVQVLAANIDTVFVVHSIAEQPNLRRIERELSLAWDSNAVPVVVLTKADLSADAEAARREVQSVGSGVDVLVTNALSGQTPELLLPYITDHRTAVLVGPSGAGKSTLINALLGEERQATREVRVGDGRGRHTTVARELIQMPRGGVLIDTPGIRALGLTGSEEGIASVFSDIEEAARACRFRDCTHEDEPGCAVRAAVESGTLSAERLASYRKLMREAHEVAAKTDARFAQNEAVEVERAEENGVENKVVARFADGHTIKGTTFDFLPGKDIFHVVEAAAPTGAHPVEIHTRDLKALFFVKDLVGNPQRDKSAEAGPLRPAVGRRIKVVFKDGEVLEGTTTGYQPDRPGFFLEPLDASRNEERCYVITSAATQIILV